MANFELFRFVDVHSPDYLSRDNNPFTTSFDDLITAGGTSALVDDIGVTTFEWTKKLRDLSINFKS